MDLIVACGLCGADPATDTLVQSALAAVISGPYLFRSQIFGAIRRVRGRSRAGAIEAADAVCPMPSAEDGQLEG